MAIQDSIKKLIEDLSDEAREFHKSYILSIDKKQVANSMRMLSLYLCTRRFVSMLAAILEEEINK